MRTGRYVLAGVLACVAIALGAVTSARAAVITDSATLPVLGSPYISATGAGCFPAAGVCVAPGTFTPTALVSSTFTSSGQEIVAAITFLGALTTLSNVPLGPLTLTGTLEELVEGRTSDTELGTWETELTALSLTGSVLGNTLTVALDPANPSTGSTSIVPVPGQEGRFAIDSFFDVFVELTLDSATPLQTTRGPIRVTLVPAPATLALLLLGLAGLARSGRRNAMALAIPAALGAILAGPAVAADAPLGKWSTVDDKTGKVTSEVQLYDEGGKLYGKIVGLPEPNDEKGKPKVCTKCQGADKNQPIVGLVIVKGLGRDGERYKGGTILDPEDGKVYKAEVWTEGGNLKVRGYLGPFYKTQTWKKAAN